MTKIWMMLFATAMLLAWGAIQMVIFLLAPAPLPSAAYTRRIEIKPNTSFSDIAAQLERTALITNRFYFQMLGLWTQTDKKIQAGEFMLPAGLRPLEVLDTLVQGKSIASHTVTFPEGVTFRQIMEILRRLEQEGLIHTTPHFGMDDPHLIEQTGGYPLEGYLFPETYTFTKDASAQEILLQALAQFNAVYTDAFEKQAQALGMSRHAIVTLASIIEKESSRRSEQGLISAVFHNRLKSGMRLQSDPTVIFGMPEFNGNLTQHDLQTPTPYNTYLIDGLPPGPIANPGRAAIEAALFPAPVDYLFFVSKNDGTHAFSRTLSEHNAAVTKFQKRSG